MSRSKITRFMCCRQCVETRQKPQLEVGLAPLGERGVGIRVWCRRHDREVVSFTPDDLAEIVASNPPCECCPGGVHVN